MTQVDRARAAASHNEVGCIRKCIFYERSFHTFVNALKVQNHVHKHAGYLIQSGIQLPRSYQRSDLSSGSLNKP